MKVSLRLKLSAVFFGITLLLFLIVSVLANTVLERQFKNYVIESLQSRMDDTVSLLSSRYSDWNAKWDVAGIETIGVNALGNGLIVKVADKNGKSVWDATEHNGGMCAAILEHMAQNMAGHSSEFQGGYAEKQVPLMMKNAQVGTATVGYYGPYFFNDSDVKFLRTLNSLLLWSAVAASCVSLAFGIYMAKRLSGPINRAIGVAKRIAKGEFDGRIREPSGTREIIDLTETVNGLAETLGRKDLHRKRLTADVAHELRTPIATLQSHLEAMIDGIWAPDAERLKSCHEETERLSRLVGDLERLARYESENLALDKRRFDLSAMLGRIVTNFESQYRNKGIKLKFTPRETIVTADEDKLSQVFINLISNAWKYSVAGGAVEITVDDAGDEIRVSVSDTGAGISEEDLPYVFERFYRTDKSRSRLTGGSGIGLTIAKAIVEAHQGRISVCSELNRGSVFTVMLPK